MFLYLRMLIIMLASFYIVRLLLIKLGVTDYGVFNITAGFITIFLFITNSLSSACQRFFALELVKKNIVKLNKLWNTVILIFLLLSFSILILGETIGVWFLKNYLVIPEARSDAAFWVFQFTLFTLLFTTMSVPYNALIIAKEKMNIYAVISIIDICLKLVIVLLIKYSTYDKLIFYSTELLLVSIITFLLYSFYCHYRFNECKFFFKNLDRNTLYQISNYSGWNLVGAFSIVSKTQGINIILNMFFGPAINASYAIAIQINSAISTFTNNFFTAVRPQILKNFENNFTQTISLALKSAKYSFFLIYIISLPVLLETKYIFSFWLDEIPNKTIIFSRLIIINSILEVLNYPIVTLVQATGNIKFYQLTVGIILILNLPLSILFLKWGFEPEITFIIMLFLTILSFLPRLIITNKIAKMPIKSFYLQVLQPISASILIALVLSLSLRIYLPEGATRFFLILVANFFTTLINIYYFGIDQKEKVFISNNLLKKENDYLQKDKK